MEEDDPLNLLLLLMLDDRSFLNLSGMTKGAFYKLEGIMFPDLDYQKRGRPPILDTFGQLG